MKVSLGVLLFLTFSPDISGFKLLSFTGSSSCPPSGWRGVHLNPPAATALRDGPSSHRPPSPPELTLKEDVYRIIYQLLESQREIESESDRDSSGETRLDTKILLDNAHILVQSNIYEQAMEELLNSCDSEEAVNTLERIDGFVGSFIQNERKSRCRLKLTYLINGATSNRLEEAISKLSNADEIDENLLRFVDSLIQKRIFMVGGPTADREDEILLPSSGKDAVNVLKLVYQRLKAEIQLKEDFNLKLLAILISEKDDDNLDSILRKALTTVEKFQVFSNYVEEGIEHLSQLIEQRSSESMNDQNDSGGKIETLQRMRDILWRMSEFSKNFKTGLSDDSDLFSTDAEDYISEPT